jgi:uncharacterized protein (TIGR02391 family)
MLRSRRFASRRWTAVELHTSGSRGLRTATFDERSDNDTEYLKLLRPGPPVSDARSWSAPRATDAYSRSIDIDWALGELRGLVDMTDLVTPAATPGVVFLGDDRYPKGGDAIPAQVQVIEQILARVLPRWRIDVVDPDKGERSRWQHHRRACLQAIAQLERAEELRERLGDNAPTLDVSGLHPWIWEGARSLWNSGHFREAVLASMRKLNAETQNRVGRRDVSETDLFVQAFSDDDPLAGRSRLRPKDDDGKSAKSFRRGVRSFAEGCFAMLRNPGSHDELEELDETEAIEQLAALSILARIVDESDVLTVDRP